MKKIPVGATIAHAYRFAFGNSLTVLKAIWLPLLAQLAVAFLVIRRMALFLTALQERDPSATSLFGPLLLLIPLIAIFFFAQFAAATQTALGRPPQSWLAFHFGKPMWRLLGGFLGALLTILAIAMVSLLALWLLALGLDLVLKIAPSARPVVAILGGLLVMAFGCSLFFFSVRFLFLLAPINVSEQRPGIKRAWELSAGNFWRALLVILAIAIPISAVNYAYVFSVAGFPPVTVGATKEAKEVADIAWRIVELNAMANRWYLTLPLTALMMLFQLGAGCAAQVFAYRALTEDEGLAPIAGD